MLSSDHFEYCQYIQESNPRTLLAVESPSPEIYIKPYHFIRLTNSSTLTKRATDPWRRYILTEILGVLHK